MSSVGSFTCFRSADILRLEAYGTVRALELTQADQRKDVLYHADSGE